MSLDPTSFEILIVLMAATVMPTFLVRGGWDYDGYSSEIADALLTA